MKGVRSQEHGGMSWNGLFFSVSILIEETISEGTSSQYCIGADGKGASVLQEQWNLRRSGQRGRRKPSGAEGSLHSWGLVTDTEFRLEVDRLASIQVQM